MPWWDIYFNDLYLRMFETILTPERTAQEVAGVMTMLDLRPDSRILDLCCGQGRHAFLFAQEGFDVFGFDLSKTLLQVAKYKNSQTDNTFFVQADMRCLPAVDTFDLLLNLFTSFGYFESDSENKTVFEQFHQVLKSGGYYVFDYFHTFVIRKFL